MIDKFYKEIKKNYQLYLLLFLPIVYILVFNYFPMYGVQIAFKNYRFADGIWGSKWVGLDQFVKFIDSYQFERVLKNTFIISLYGLIASFPIPIILALALNNTKNSKFKKIVQTTTYAPNFISVVVVVGLILQLLSTKTGIVNKLITLLGGDEIQFMAIPEIFSSIYVWSGIWQHAGWGSIIYLAALAGVDQSTHEAAIVDGATIIQRNIHIDIPGIMPTMTISLILSMSSILSVDFAKIFLMQNPLNLSNSEVISTYLYKVSLQSALPNFSFGAAIGLINSIVSLVLILITNYIAKKVGETSLF